MMKTRIIALVGKAGSGKDTCLKSAIAALPRLKGIISCTTRPSRQGEREGIDYYFLSNDKFAEKILNGEMLEATYFNDWHYGTMRSSLSTEYVNIGVFNPDGIYALVDNPSIDLSLVYIKCSDKIRMMRQLQREQYPNVDEIVRRYNTDKLDFEELEDNISNYKTFWNEQISDIDRFVQFLKREVI